MNKDLKKTMFFSFIMVSLIGTLVHFFYGCSNNNLLVGLIAPINESVWEHIKLLFFPMLITVAILTPKLQAMYPAILSGILSSTFIGCLLIPTLFYTYSGIIGQHIGAIDIAIYYICVLITFFLAYRFTLNEFFIRYTRLLQILAVLLVLIFWIFTYFPPELPLFQPPAN